MTDQSKPIAPTAWAALREWVGRSELSNDELVASPLRGLAATLDRGDVRLESGDELPALWHWLYFLPQVPQAALGIDGHPPVGGFLPPVPLPRRMWAGGRVQWNTPLRVGDRIQRASRIASVDHKSGRTGDLVFVTIQHEISTGGDHPALSEEQDIVYREAAKTGSTSPAPQRAPVDASWSREINPDPVLLFHYSALTFNGHRIHYDRDYATSVEGYAGLVVHGPLIASLLADLALRELPAVTLRSFAFKALRPTFDLQPFRVCGKPSADGKSADLWAQDHDGWLTMRAEMQFN